MTRPRALAPGLALVGALLVGLGMACGAGSERVAAPDFEHTNLDGQRVRLSDLRGRIVVIDFWATWCAPCIFQPAELNRLWRGHRASGDLVVLGVEVGGAGPDEIRSWQADNDAVAEYPIVVGADEGLARRFGVVGFPATVVVTPDGRIDSVHVGLTSAEELEEALAEARSATLAGDG